MAAAPMSPSSPGEPAPARPGGQADRRWVYLDHAATTPLRPQAREGLLDALEVEANPTAGHAWGRRAAGLLADARGRLAEVVGCTPAELVLTSGGTESCDLAINGTVTSPGSPDRPSVLCSAIEHHAVLDPVRALGGQAVPVDARGLIDLEALGAALHPGVRLVSVMLVNNEVGAVQPLAEVAALVRRLAPGAVLHTDASQALTWLDVAEHAAPADLVTICAHKFGGPVGVGALVVRDGAHIEARLLGGGQERGRRSGTPNVAGAVAMAAAAEATASDRDDLARRLRAWRDQLVRTVQDGVPGVVETASPDGDRSHLAAGFAHLCLPAVHREALLFRLEHDHGVLASGGSSCASGADTASHVVEAIGVPEPLRAGSLRLTMGWTTTADDVAHAADDVVAAARALAPHARDGVPA